MAEEFTISPTNKSKGEISGQNRKKIVMSPIQESKEEISWQNHKKICYKFNNTTFPWKKHSCEQNNILDFTQIFPNFHKNC